MKSTKRRAGGFPNQKGESATALQSVAPSELTNLALSLTKEVSGEEDEAESRDMAEAECELDSSPIEVLSEASVGSLSVAVLSSAATFCCGGQEAASKLLHSDETVKPSVKSETAGTNANYPPERWFMLFSSSLLQLNPRLFSVPHRSSSGGPGSLMFVRLRVQPSAGKKKLGSTKTLPRRDSWLALSQDRYSN